MICVTVCVKEVWLFLCLLVSAFTAWYIIFHTRGQQIMVLLEHSYKQLSAWEFIGEHIVFKQLYEWDHQPSNWWIPHDIFSICFNFYPKRGVDMNIYFSNYVSTGKVDFMKLYSFFCLFYPIIMYDILNNMICLVIYDVMFTLDYVDITEI